MTSPVSGLSEVLSRIAAIQTEMSTPPAVLAGLVPAAATTSATASTTAPASTLPSSTVTTTPAAPTTSFQNTLDQAQGASVTQNGVTYSAKSANVTGADIVSDAESYLGVPYVYAGTTRAGGMDCSGLVQTTYKDLGMQLPRISYQQQKVGVAIPSLAQAQPGDVLAFGQPAYHVAIYIGNGKMIEAPQPGENVKIANVSPTPSSIRRIVPTGIASDGTAVANVPAASAASAATVSAPVSSSSPLATYSSLFSTDEAKYGLPTGLLGAVAKTESGGNANAVSPAGAEGLMQLMPGTAKSLGVDPLNPTQAVDGAARMLQGLLQKYHGSLTLALAAYNAGPGAVDHYGGVPPYPETQNYVVKVTAAMKGATT
jgi:cell wall-associated NlpC family hydrolase